VLTRARPSSLSLPFPQNKIIVQESANERAADLAKNAVFTDGAARHAQLLVEAGVNPVTGLTHHVAPERAVLEDAHVGLARARGP
jgi:hypothetical protein